MSVPNDTNGDTSARRVYLGLGSNVGDRRANLRFGLDALGAVVAIDAISSVYDTAPLLVTEQPRFYNLACAGTTLLEPLALLHALKEIERRAGRTEGPRYGPRSLDIDILFYDDVVLDTPELTVPHPGLQDRAFVLEPLAEIAPNLYHPALGAPIETLRKAAETSDVRRLGVL